MLNVPQSNNFLHDFLAQFIFIWYFCGLKKQNVRENSDNDM